jgi:hypothetical protein
VYLPATQTVQTEAEYLPATQTVQTEALSLKEKVPGTQSMQSELPDPEYLPLVHSMQVLKYSIPDKESILENVPDGQSAQSSPNELDFFPAAQLTQTELPANEYMPPTQKVHVESDFLAL